jgi:hypothetical protein
MAGLTPQVAIDDRALQARLHAGVDGRIVWVTNPTRTEKKVTVTVGGEGFHSAEDVWGGVAIACAGQTFVVSVPARDAVVARLG